MSIFKSIRKTTLPALALAAVHVVALAGCSSDALVGGLGFVEVSWTIKGQQVSQTVCAASGAEKVRITWGTAPPVTYGCVTGKVRRAAGDGAKLKITLELLSAQEAVMDQRDKDVVVEDEKTTTFAVDFMGTAKLDAGVEAGMDASADTGLAKEAGADGPAVDTGADGPVIDASADGPVSDSGSPDMISGPDA